MSSNAPLFCLSLLFGVSCLSQVLFTNMSVYLSSWMMRPLCTGTLQLFWAGLWVKDFLAAPMKVQPEAPRPRSLPLVASLHSSGPPNNSNILPHLNITPVALPYKNWLEKDFVSNLWLRKMSILDTTGCASCGPQPNLKGEGNYAKKVQA